jgi:hypothetical protein
MPNLADLSPALRERTAGYALDWLTDKQEVWAWEHLWNLSDFIRLNGYEVLLLVSADHHPNLTVERCLVDAAGDTVAFVLCDTTIWDHLQASERTRIDPQWRDEYIYFFAVCVRMPEAEFFIATVYHACRLKPLPTMRRSR